MLSALFPEHRHASTAVGAAAGTPCQPACYPSGQQLPWSSELAKQGRL